MSGKAKTAQKAQGGRRPHDPGYKHPPSGVVKVLEFRKNPRGNRVPKLVLRREQA